MATATALSTVQKLYIAYYGRAADAAGQLYWADKLDAAKGSLAGIIDAFATSAEAQALYGTGTTNVARVTVLYQNILGRAPETAGLNYYVDQLNRGKVSLGNLALAILDGVKPGTSDAPLADNRIAVANSFTSKVSTAPKSYDGDVAAAIARTFLKSVTGDAATVTSANAQLDAYLNTIGVASKQPAKFASLVDKGLLTSTAIVSKGLTEANLDASLKALTPTTAATSGKIIDGYIKGATVFADANGDGKQDPGEVSAITDDKGNFTLPPGAVGNLVSQGGTDISTNLPFKGVLTAPAGSTVVNPITTLVNNLVQSGQDVATAQQKVAQALNLPSNVDVTTFDPLNVATDKNAKPEEKQAALAIQKAAATVANILVQTASAVAGAAPNADQNKVATQAAQTLANLINNTETGKTLDLTSTSTLSSVLSEAGKDLGAEDKTKLEKVQTQVVQVMLQTNEALEKVGTTGNVDPLQALVDMAKAQVVAQGDSAAALQNAVSTGDATQATNTFTGENLDKQVTEATPGTIGESTPAPAPPPPAPAPTPTPAPGGGGESNPSPPPPPNGTRTNPATDETTGNDVINANQRTVMSEPKAFNAANGNDEYVVKTSVLDNAANITITGFSTSDKLVFDADPNATLATLDAIYSISDNLTNVTLVANVGGSVQQITLVGLTGSRTAVGGAIDTITELSSFLGAGAIELI